MIPDSYPLHDPVKGPLSNVLIDAKYLYGPRGVPTLRTPLPGPYELRTKFRLGGTYRGLYRVVGGTSEGIDYKSSPGHILRPLHRIEIL